ncbi:hypothetical protein [Facklamia miroungae]|uniref:Uncharacterized protein n=1 Tax=Facklamia miroungae TaxID=120956 RepID=A0A1G7THY5_9LACT|nr:hypothetical protein [Facklamia miroungae]NKZ29852.1 hypothetical protein [Facklamia miroungae]SDG34140.1 hypothetical protein SAMN05421791_1062 [Facklamia miroungae]
MGKKGIGFCIKFCLSMLFSLQLFTPDFASANQLLKEDLQENSTMREEVFDKDLLDQLSKSLSDLEKIEKFEVKMSWTNLDQEQQMGQATFQMDAKKGNLKGNVMYNLDNYYPPEAHLNFISYGRHRLLYIQEFELLNSLAYFKQAHFDYRFDESVNKYNDLYTEFSDESIDTINLIEKPSASLIVIPNMDKLKKIDSGQISYDEGQYHLNIERMDIPSLFFDKEPFFSMSYKIDHLIQAPSSSTMQSFQDWENHFNHQIKINEEANDFLLGVKIESELPNRSKKNDNHYRTPQFNKLFSLSSQGLTEKLTGFKMDYDPIKKTLKVVVEGIVEDVAFNFFSKDTAELSTKRVRLEYSFEPKEVIIPERETLKTISPAAANYLMEELLTKENE